MILSIIGCILIVVGIFLFHQANQIKIEKQEQQQNYKYILTNEVNKLKKEKIELLNFQQQKEQWKQNRINEIQKDLQIYKQNIDKSKEDYIYQFEQQKQEEIQKKRNFLNQIAEEKNQAQKQLDKIKTSLAAGVEARLREQEKNEQINFYKLSINKEDLSDVKKLENLKSSFHKPVVLSKLIWSQYFQKQMTELCNRILGKNKICGIYKITDLLTEQCYIGQSVDVATRWKSHCKCGLGIEAPSTNVLYNTMQKDGIWNFTFELLEQCPKEQLNEKESFWIQMYQSDKFGFNGNAGVKK